MPVLRKLSNLVGQLRRTIGTAAGFAITYGMYKTLLDENNSFVMKARNEAPPFVSTRIQKPPFDDTSALSTRSPSNLSPSTAKPQPCVVSHDKAFALFICLRVKDGADVGKVASSVAKIQQYVEEVESPAISCCGNYQIYAGVGFGPEFYQLLKSGMPQPFSNAKHNLLSEGSVGGDVLIHAKSNTQGMLQQLSQKVRNNLPQDCILSHEETYGEHKDAEIVAKRQSPGEPLGILNYQYSKGELELVPPSTAAYKPAKPSLMFVQEAGNEDTEPRRRDIAVHPHTGGSYVLTQRWVHNVKTPDNKCRICMNYWVDKAWEECTHILGDRRFRNGPDVLREDSATKKTDKWMSEAYTDCLALQKEHPNIVCSPGSFAPPYPNRIVRQSVPYQKPGGELGLFFISYCCSPQQHTVLINRLVASMCGEDRLNSACSAVFRLSRNVHSACWYFPGMDELAALRD